MWLLCSLAALAAEPATEVELGAGVTARVSRDDTFSDRPYTGATPLSGALALRRDGERWRHDLAVQVDHAAMHAGPAYPVRWSEDEPWIDTGSSPFFRVDLSYRAGVRVVDGPVRVEVGGVSRNRVETRNHDYGFTGVFGYIGMFAVGPWARVSTAPGPWTLSADLDLVAAGWGTRSPYAINDDPYMRAIEDHNGLKTFAMHIGRGRPITALSTQDVRLGLGLSRRLTDTWALSLRSELELFHERRPAPITDLVSTTRLGLAARF